MSRRKKIIMGALILSLMVLVGIGTTMTYGPRGSWAKGFPPGFHGMGCHPGPHGHGEDIADFILWKMDRHVKELNLNDAQKKAPITNRQLRPFKPGGEEELKKQLNEPH